jgi:hypothetical protein
VQPPAEARKGGDHSDAPVALHAAQDPNL